MFFTLDANLRIEGVKDAAGRPLEFFQPKDPKGDRQTHGDYVVIVLAEPARSGQETVIEFVYEGKHVIRNMGSGNFFCRSFGWYPTRRNSFASRADFDLVFLSPKKLTLVATGKEVREAPEGDWTLTAWESEIPICVAGFAFGDFKTYSTTAGKVDVQIYANASPDDLLRSLEITAQGGAHPTQGPRMDIPLGSLRPAALMKVMGEEVANTIRLFEQYFGPYPYGHISVTNIPFSFGQGWPMLLYLSAITFLDGTQRHLLGVTDHVQLTDYFRAHEASHQWWGHRVSWKSYRDQWLSEGFAQFSGNLYVLYRRNEGEFISRLKKDREELDMTDDRNRKLESLGPISMGMRLSSSDALRGYSTVVYNKGGYVLHMLRMMLLDPRAARPEGAFMAMMQDFTSAYHNRPASTADFKAVAEKHMTSTVDLEQNGRLDWLFRQYVNGTGIPEYRFSYQVQDIGSGRFRCEGMIRQSGVPEGWMDILPIYIQNQGKLYRVGWANVRRKDTPIAFDLPMRPEKIILNAKKDILADIKQ